MSTLCEIALAFSLALDTCAAELPLDLPPGDAVVWDYQVPEPAPEPEPEPPKPEPVIIYRDVVRVEPAKPPEESQKQPETVPPPPAPETGFNIAAVDRIYRLRVEAGLASSGAAIPLGSRPASPGGERPESGGTIALPPAPARYAHPGIAGGDPVDNALILAEDRYVTGNLETSINTQLDGSVIIQTSRDVFGYHGQRILLAKGSRMVCDYKAPKKIGEHRIALTCNRVLTAERRAEIYEVAAPVGDIQGRAGITGDVDNRFLESYGSAFVLTFISASVRAAVASARDTGSDDTDDAIISEAGEEISTRFGEITASVLQRTLNLKPIITVPQGTRVQIRPASDWYIRPVVEN